MGMFDAERQQLGITTATATKPSASATTKTAAPTKSMFADERAAISAPPKPAANINTLGGVGSSSYGPTPTHTIEPPKPSAWQSITNNPIVHGAETALGTVNKVYDKVSHLPVINQVTGAMQGMVEPFVHSDAAASNKPLWEKYLGNVKDAVNLTHNLLNPTSFITGNLVPSPNDKTIIDKTKAAIQSPQSLVKGILNPDQARQDLTNSLKSRSTVMNLATESLADPLSYVPMPSIKGVKGVSSAIGDTFDRLFGKVKPAEAKSPILGLPAAKTPAEIAQMPLKDRLQYTDELQARPKKVSTEPLGLPQGNYTAPTRLKVAGNNQLLDHVITKIKPEVMSIIQAPTRRDLLVQYIQKNTGYAIEDIHNRPNNELQEMGQVVQGELQKKMQQIATQVAAKHGHDLPSLLEGKGPNIAEQAAKDAQSRVYGVPAPDVNIRKPTFNVTHESPAAAPRELYQTVPTDQTLADARKLRGQAPAKIIGTKAVKLSDMRGQSAEKVAATVERPKTSPQPILNRTELKHADTIKTSENSTPELRQALEDKTMTGKTTSDVINRTKAAEYIAQHGQEGAANKIIAKQGKLQPHEVTAAQILAKQYATKGGEANLNKALDIISKTATEGRQMGQAIQALSQWNKLDSEGALLQATRSAGRTLTPAEGKPIVAAAEHVQQVAATKSLSDEVMHIVTNKAPGEELTAAEKAKIQEFQTQVKKVNEGLKPFLPKENIVKESKTDAAIKEVSQIEPKARTRDQVVSFLDAKAEKARARLAASRNKISSTPFDTYADMAIIGASHIAKGVVKLSDFTEQMVKDFGTAVKPQINEIFNRANNIFRKENGLPTVQELDKAVNGAIKNGSFTEEQAGQFKAWANEIGHYADKNLKIEATQDLQKAMNEIGTSTLGQKASAVQTPMQLLSAPTLERNVIGNEAFNILQKINKISAVPIDWTLSKFTGERNIVFKTGNQEKYWKNFVQGAKSGWKGVSPNGQFASLDIHPEAFKSNANPFKYLQKAMGAMLQSFDHAAYMRAYGETLGTYAKLSGKDINELDETIHELSDQAGQYATFQDKNWLSDAATGTKRLFNKPTDMIADAAVNRGMLPEKLSTKGFGMGDLILKYAKTPANIVMRGIDFSPLGFLRGLGELAPLIFKREAFNQQKAVMALSRAITGTLGLTVPGYVLANAGILTGSSSSDADIRSLDTQTGKGEYKVNWSALERYITGGLDRNAAQWQKGDRIFDWGWLQPMAISIAMGVNAQQSIAKQNADGTKSYIGIAKDALVGSLKTILQQPLLQGVQSLVTGVGDVARFGSWTGIANIFKGAPASFVPAISGQVRNFTDNTARNTYDPNGWKTALNMIVNKIPGLDKQLPIAYSTLGQANEQIQGGQANTLSQAAKTFLSPVKITNYTVSPEAKMVMDLINSTGNTTVAPRTPNKYLMVNKRKIELTSKQYSEIQQKTGEATQTALSKLHIYLSNDANSDEAKIKKVVDTLKSVGDGVRTQLNKEYPELKPLTPYQLKHMTK